MIQALVRTGLILGSMGSFLVSQAQEEAVDDASTPEPSVEEGKPDLSDSDTVPEVKPEEESLPVGPPEPPRSHWLGVLIEDVIASSDLPEQRRERLESMVRAAYEQASWKPLWKKIGPAEVFKYYGHLYQQHGLNQGSIPLFPLTEEMMARKVKKVTAENVWTTVRVAEACLILRLGHAAEECFWPHWNDTEEPGNHSEKAFREYLGKRFATALSEAPGEPTEILASFAPRNWIYEKIRKAWMQYESAPDPIQLKVKGNILEGRPFPQSQELAYFLKEMGFLGAEEARYIGDVFTKELSEALRAYQKANGLWADGILGPRTAYHLGKKPKDYASTLALNLHRARLFPDEMGERYLLANIPDGHVYGYEEQNVTESMRIVFGANTEDRRTPFFRDTLETVIFRPYWWIPKSIATKEYLPRVRKDFSYLRRNGYELVTGTGTAMKVTSSNLNKVEKGALFLRQNSGSGNALGRVKFIFPNEHHVYMHDTPAKSLFKRSYRAHSHGCVRLQHPDRMATWVLNGEGDWNKHSVHHAMFRTSKRNEVILEKQIEVFIVYFTAFPRSDGKEGINYYADIYKRDPSDQAKIDQSNSPRNLAPAVVKR